MDLLDRLLGHDTWTTARLLELALPLTDDQLDQEFDLGHGTVRKTFDHLIGNIECWTDLMREVEVQRRQQEDLSIQTLRKRHRLAAEKFQSFARQIVDQNRLEDSFLDVLDDPPRRKSFGGVIVHLATHGMHHRAQLLFMLKRLGVQNLPEGDALSWEHIRKEC